MKWRGGAEAGISRIGAGATARWQDFAGAGLRAMLAISCFAGIDGAPLLEGQGGFSSGGSPEITEADRQAGKFVSLSPADTEDVWSALFEAQGGALHGPVTLVLCKGVMQSACGGAI